MRGCTVLWKHDTDRVWVFGSRVYEESEHRYQLLRIDPETGRTLATFGAGWPELQAPSTAIDASVDSR
jgi:hypothetical protein